MYEIRKSAREYFTSLGRWGWLVLVELIGATAGLALDANRIENIPDGWWWAMIIATLIIVPFIIFHRMRLKLDRMLGPKLERLREASKAIRAIPHKEDMTEGFRRLDAAALVGRLFLDAMESGLFQEPRHALIRAKMKVLLVHGWSHQQVPKDAGVDPPDILFSAFYDAVTWLRQERGQKGIPWREGDGLALLAMGTGFLADVIDQEVERMERERRA